MGRPRKDEADSLPAPSRPPATTPQARENQIINLAIDLTEKQMIEGTVSATVQVHYLKLATTKEQLEREKLKNENLLLQARVQSMASEGDMKQLLENALDAFRGYQGTPDEEVFLD